MKSFKKNQIIRYVNKMNNTGDYYLTLGKAYKVIGFGAFGNVDITVMCDDERPRTFNYKRFIGVEMSKKVHVI